jgi:hypothetical protein
MDFKQANADCYDATRDSKILIGIQSSIPILKTFSLTIQNPAKYKHAMALDISPMPIRAVTTELSTQ